MRRPRAQATRANEPKNPFYQGFKAASPRNLIIAASLLAISSLFFIAENSAARRQDDAFSDIKTAKLEIDLSAAEPIADSTPQKLVEPEIEPVSIKVRNGDSMSLVFSRAGLGAPTVHKLAYESRHGKSFSRILPGKTFLFYFDKDKELQKIVYQIDKLESYEAIASESGFKTSHILLEPEIFNTIKSGEIANSFYMDGLNAGLNDNLIMELVSIFGWDIDFALEIRKSDQFSVLYEEKYLDGEYLGTGRILAAEFVNRGKAVRAVRYEDKSGRTAFYTPEGLSMRKAFLRLPVKFSRVSSNFNPRRLHPVTGSIRPHRGVDYAAPTGTPVYATGDGKVITSTYDKYSGNYIVIRHGQTYQTKYLHLSKRKVRVGQTVKQGQTIGLVGATGRVTGAHLHYEFLVNGVHNNPRTVKLPNGKPVKASELDNFKLVTKPLLAKLEVSKETFIAQTLNQSSNDS